MSRLGMLGARLYRGEASYEFVSKRKIWYAISAALLVISIGSLLTLKLTLGIEFKGGAEFRVTSPAATESAMLDTVSSIAHGEVVVQRVGTNQVRAQTEKLTSAQLEEVQQALIDRFHVSEASIDTQFIGPSWGKDVSSKALRALVFFLLGVIVFLSIYFEPKMAAAAMAALIHDLVITAGIYSLVGFEVTPATVIGFLTILGYSLYDTVVVFDKVRENTAGLAGGSRMTYSQAANLAVNQTLVRSINTTIIALLPIAAILFAGIVLLGAGPLKDLSLALFVGVAIGAYSSIFIATPILAQLKEREPGMQALAKRVGARAAGGGGKAPARGTVTSRRAAAAEAASVDDDLELDDQAEPATAAARSASRPPPARRPGQPQRNQPRKGRNRPGGKKRR